MNYQGQTQNPRGHITPFQKCCNDRMSAKCRNIRKKKKMPMRFYLRRIVFPRTVCFVLGIAAGAVFAGTISSKSTTPPETPALYGTRDGQAFVESADFEYTVDEFTPIDCELSEDLQEYTYYLCKAYYIDYHFALAVMYHESRFDANAVGADGHDIGLMQIRDINNNALYEAIGVTDMTDPYQNIHAGLYILRGLFEKYDNPSIVLMVYNMGEKGASRLWDVGIYETKYTQEILMLADEYKNIKK